MCTHRTGIPLIASLSKRASPAVGVGIDRPAGHKLVVCQRGARHLERPVWGSPAMSWWAIAAVARPMTLTADTQVIPVAGRRPETANRVDAVVVTHSQPRLALECLASLQRLIPPGQSVVVVNHPADADPAELSALRTYGSVITNKRLRGYGENLNRGVRALPEGAEFLLLLNDDLVFAEGAAERLVAALVSDPHAGLAGPNIVGADGSPHPAVFSFPSIWSEVLQAAILPAGFANVLRARHVAAAAAGPPRQVDWVLGAAMLVRRRAFEDVGGFDPGYFLYSEETDLCRRLHRQGWSVLSCGDAIVTHLAAASTGDERFSRMLGRSRARYLRRTLPPRRQLALASALAFAHAWNVLYVAGRIALAPATAGEKLGLLKQHWRSRPILQRDDSAKIYPHDGH
jgi:N-acetylglucosaminyl-diphospho-decaprenol L-rhamnosyltransferase